MTQQFPNDPIQPTAEFPAIGGTGPADDVVTGREPVEPNARRSKRIVIAVLAGGLVLGGGAVAYAAAGSSPTASAPAGAEGGPGTEGGAGLPGGPSGAGGASGAHEPHIDGTVTAASGNTITVTDPDGFSRTIDVTSSTTYENGLTSPVATGTKIHATGTVDADKTSLDATTIATAPTPPSSPTAAPGAGKGPGSGKGPGGSKPTDAPSAPTAQPSATGS